MYDRIRGLREDKDLTQKTLSSLLGVHQTTYSDYELGNLNIPIPIITKLAQIFETSVDYLVNLTDEKSPYPRKK